MVVTVLADENMPGLDVLDGRVVLRRLAGRTIGREHLSDVDALLIRSVTRADETLLNDSPVGFVGSATIGSDHMDLPWLARRGIRTALAPGCNAAAVAEYVLQAVLRWALKQGTSLQGKTAGVLGYGQVGRRVASLLEALGMTVLVRDPPLRADGENIPFPDFDRHQLPELDVLSLHVPLIREGEHATLHWLSAETLAAMSCDQLLINTCRGEVIDDFANLPVAATLVMDVWPQEPWVSGQQLSRTWLGSPHVAGYSLEGKLRGSMMVLQALNAWHQARTGEVLLPVDQLGVTQQRGEWDRPVDSAEGLLDLLISRYDMTRDHQAMLAMVNADEDSTVRSAAFDSLRKHYPVRHEVAGLQLTAGGTEPWLSVCRLLGVQT